MKVTFLHFEIILTNNANKMLIDIILIVVKFLHEKYEYRAFILLQRIIQDSKNAF